jgi:hypothetical protein
VFVSSVMLWVDVLSVTLSVGRFDEVKEHTTKEAANVIEEIKAHHIHLANARDRCLPPPSYAQPCMNRS